MSPFSESLRQIRFSRGLRQQELADRVGCERSYLSALENDLKRAPPVEFVEQLCKTLELTDVEADALYQARITSQRRYSVPTQSPKETYEVAYEFFSRIENLSALQLQGLMTVLKLGTSSSASREIRVRRKDRGAQRDKEDAM